MRPLSTAALAAFGVGAHAFAFIGAPVARFETRPSNMRMAITIPKTTTVPDLLIKTEQLKLLSTAAKLGLLSKLEQAGLTLKDVEKLLPLIDEYDVIGTGLALGDDVLAVAPAALEAAPALLPLAALALNIPPGLLFAGALGSLAAGAAVINFIPDDSVTNIALQTFLAVPLLAIVPAASVIGGVILGKINDGTLISSLPLPKAGASFSAAVSAPAVKAVVKSNAAARRPTISLAKTAPMTGSRMAPVEASAQPAVTKKTARAIPKAAAGSLRPTTLKLVASPVAAVKSVAAAPAAVKSIPKSLPKAPAAAIKSIPKAAPAPVKAAVKQAAPAIKQTVSKPAAAVKKAAPAIKSAAAKPVATIKAAAKPLPKPAPKPAAPKPAIKAAAPKIAAPKPAAPKPVAAATVSAKAPAASASRFKAAAPSKTLGSLSNIPKQPTK